MPPPREGYPHSKFFIFLFFYFFWEFIRLGRLWYLFVGIFFYLCDME